MSEELLVDRDTMQAALLAIEERLCKDVEVPRPEDVALYLARYPDLAEVVEALCATTRREFGPAASLSLEVYRDPEIEDEYLALYVRLPKYTLDVLQRIRAVAAAHESQLWDKSGTILVTTDFRAIRD